MSTGIFVKGNPKSRNRLKARKWIEEANGISTIGLKILPGASLPPQAVAIANVLFTRVCGSLPL